MLAWVVICTTSSSPVTRPFIGGVKSDVKSDVKWEVLEVMLKGRYYWEYEEGGSHVEHPHCDVKKIDIRRKRRKSQSTRVADNGQVSDNL